ncbi:MAG: hypothetical protein PHW53_04980 [Patescibacteria group bacterium]|nr:hypothetical protein [Patescibacteria group bacterium]
MELVETPSPQIEQVDLPGDIVVVDSPALEVLDAARPELAVLDESGGLILIDTPSLEFAELGVQGPPGIQGIPGPSGGVALQLTAGVALGGNRLITGAAQYADSSDAATAGRAIGITAGAASAGALVDVVVAGELDGFGGLTINSPVYASVNGTFTQTEPVTGYSQQVGIAVSASKLMVRLFPPIILG